MIMKSAGDGHQRQPSSKRVRAEIQRGRPRIQKRLSTILREVLERKLSVEVGGKMCTISAHQALLTRALSLGLKGDMRAIKFLAEMASQLPDNTAYTSVNTEGMSAESNSGNLFQNDKTG